MTPWDTMTDREKDALVAKEMGWFWNDETAFSPSGSRNARIERDPWWWLPAYTTDRNAFAEAEAALERRGLMEAYVGAIQDFAPPGLGYETGEPFQWFLLTAPLAIRCKAALRACGVEV